ncbi:hypothetical protein [Gordonia sp. FQ]|uniref:hypothetical protein n=1 Tax=Gordonia sp. FQ TaxID=3446634 RepID=UPI003F839209
MEKKCDTCGSEFSPARADARYCSGRCRTIAYRKRNEPERAPRKRRPLPDAFWKGAFDLERRVESLGRLVADDRFGRNREVVSQMNRGSLVRVRDRLDQIIADLSHDEPAVTVTSVDDDAPRPFRKSDTEMLDEITSSIANYADLVQYVRPGEVPVEEAVTMASKARVAWQAIDRRLTNIITPSRHRLTTR